MAEKKGRQARELLSDLAAKSAALACELGALPKDVAERFGLELSREVAAHWGGQLVYIPRNLPGELDRRDLEIFEKFRGDNHAELALEYRLSVQWIYRIVKRVRQSEIDRRQRRLFD
ncbi:MULTISPECIES: Mor transcription activator family protein [Methylococcus]|uniref:Putative prophage MuMc02, transcriptional regulator n=1 Tax=Methylococcus capsulatus (strain ATCC 33009 / NCIMB 11132 / Bath) TaxID=243233 RepID=Q602W5_METCA|nr:Mor transcription activator family protein [Methylococcus capsulatus]AAU90956.1 putative prophage MuMc02, transcriptional regulator [Methylococcus capsulatus str. Bath]